MTESKLLIQDRSERASYGETNVYVGKYSRSAKTEFRRPPPSLGDIDALDQWLVLGARTQKVAAELFVPEALLQALLAIEDRRYWLHWGVDFAAVARACWMNLRGKGRIQGGSTIPEQLLRVRWEALRGRNVTKRLLRAIFSTGLLIGTGRTAILHQYLSRVYMGRNHYGIHAAARGYFGLRPYEMSPAQSVFLVERLALPNLFRADRLKVILSRALVRRILGESMSDLPETYASAFGKKAGYQVSSILAGKDAL